MKFVKRQFAKIIDKFWRPKPINDFDDMMFCVGDLWLEDLARENEKILDERLDLLLAQRRLLKERKKRFRHLDQEITELRCKQLSRGDY